MASYLTGRTECVRRGSCCSTTSALECGVPQGSVLRPVLLIMYTAGLPSLISQHAMSSHLYADDTQIYGSCRAADAEQFVGRPDECFDDVTSWM